MFSTLSVLRCFSAYHGWKEWLFELPGPSYELEPVRPWFSGQSHQDGFPLTELWLAGCRNQNSWPVSTWCYALCCLCMIGLLNNWILLVLCFLCLSFFSSCSNGLAANLNILTLGHPGAVFDPTSYSPLISYPVLLVMIFFFAVQWAL